MTSDSTFDNAAGAALTIGGTGAYTLGGFLGNSGNVTMAHGGRLDATAGGIVNRAGLLAVLGTMTGATAVSGGTLTGSGSVGAVSVGSGGGFAPGDGTPGSSMKVNGSLALTAGAQYVVQINPATASYAAMTDTASLGGATVAARYTLGSYVNKRCTILTADGSLSGTFSGPVNTNLPTNVKTALAYDGKMRTSIWI